MIKNCIWCNKEFRIKPSRYEFYFSCSKECRFEKLRYDTKLKRQLATHKTCLTCKKELPITCFWKKKDSFMASCINCSSIERKKWRDNNKDKARASSKKTYLKNKKRAIDYATKWNKDNPKKRSKIMTFQNRKRKDRMRANTGIELTANYWKLAKLHFDNKCAYCKGDGTMSVEHFIPVSKGGINCISNIIPCCVSCNTRKNNQLPVKWVVEKFNQNVLDNILYFFDKICINLYEKANQ
jgi:5-methylcytosine-specific restriction endonuclease McrA